MYSNNFEPFSLFINNNHYQVNMKSNITVQAGEPLPLGATLTAKGVNFALFSRHATAVSLVLEIPGRKPGRKKNKQQEFLLNPLTNKTGDIWHILVTGLPEKTRYGYRLSGPFQPKTTGHRYNDRLILTDPYGRALSSSAWNHGKKYLGGRPCCLIDEKSYDWEGDRPLATPLNDTIIYEMHVRGFTRHPSSEVKHPGIFAGITEKIPYLRELGITAVELMPVMEFNENEVVFKNPLTGERLKNYWGYSPISFFAPKAGYCSGRGRQIDEFRDMVKALHRAGIEVILDIVFNHTAEGGADGPTLNFRGIDNTIYYLLDPLTREYLNFSGCGNTCNCNHPIVRTLIMDALHWWVVEMHVDGFRFDLASILGRDQNGKVLSNPPVVEQIAEDPILAGCKIIAEAWDAAGLYQVGSFSNHRRWAEWNSRFRDDVRAFFCGYPGKVPALATRIAGSSDLYEHGGRSPGNSINFITSHDGFTLYDLVSYEQKHNLENGEDNRDGDNNNISWNSGVEGETDDPAIMTLRARRLRSLAVVLFLSQGTPMLVAGDEFGRSQRGNNNAWCQDNDISWLNWELARKNADQLRFFRKLIQLRREHPVFRRVDFFAAPHPKKSRSQYQEIIWQGLKPGKKDWSDEGRALAFTLNGSALDEGEDDDFFVMLSGSRDQDKTFIVPKPPPPHSRRIWKKIIDTGAGPPADITDKEQGEAITARAQITVAPMACVVLQSMPRRTPEAGPRKK